MQENNKKGNPTDHLANERTFLAWVRTSVGIMAFGFVVVKFSLFVRQISILLGKEIVLHPTGYSATVGIILVAVGTVTAILSYLRYKNIEKQLKAGDYENSSLLVTMLIVFISLISISLIVYLVEST